MKKSFVVLSPTVVQLSRVTLFTSRGNKQNVTSGQVSVCLRLIPIMTCGVLSCAPTNTNNKAAHCSPLHLSQLETVCSTEILAQTLQLFQSDEGNGGDRTQNRVVAS